jgi:hypothetical protein
MGQSGFTTLSASSGNGRCSAFASSQGARIHISLCIRREHPRRGHAPVLAGSGHAVGHCGHVKSYPLSGLVRAGREPFSGRYQKSPIRESPRVRPAARIVRPTKSLGKMPQTITYFAVLPIARRDDGRIIPDDDVGR